MKPDDAPATALTTTNSSLRPDDEERSRAGVLARLGRSAHARVRRGLQGCLDRIAVGSARVAVAGSLGTDTLQRIAEARAGGAAPVLVLCYPASPTRDDRVDVQVNGDDGGEGRRRLEAPVNGSARALETWFTEPEAGERVLRTLLFTDIVESTRRLGELGDHAWLSLLHEHDRIVARELERFGGCMENSTGDGMLASFLVPASGIRCAKAIRDDLCAIGLSVRCGLHVGEVEVRDGHVGGIAVHIAARILERAGSGEVLVSRTMTELVAGTDLRFCDRGEHDLHGVKPAWRLFAAE